MSRENEKPQILPFGPTEKKKWRRVLRTTYLIFAFAQLRAEIAQNDAGEARGTSETSENLYFRISQNRQFLLSSGALQQ